MKDAEMRLFIFGIIFLMIGLTSYLLNDKIRREKIPSQSLRASSPGGRAFLEIEEPLLVGEVDAKQTQRLFFHLF